MSKSSNSEKLSSSAMSLIVIVFLVFAAMMTLLFTIDFGGGSIF